MPKRLVIQAGYTITVFEILFSFSTKRRLGKAPERRNSVLENCEKEKNYFALVDVVACKVCMIAKMNLNMVRLIKYLPDIRFQSKVFFFFRIKYLMSLCLDLPTEWKCRQAGAFLYRETRACIADKPTKNICSNIFPCTAVTIEKIGRSRIKNIF
jgi:hypothetical protein